MRLIGVCVAALAGLAVGEVVPLDAPRLLLGALLAGLGGGLAWRWSRWRLVGLVGCAAALGGLRAALASAEQAAALEPYVGLAVRVAGMPSAPPTFGPASARLVLELDALGPAGRDPPLLEPPWRGARLLVVGDAASLGAVASGERLVLEGRLLGPSAHAPPSLLFPSLVDQPSPHAAGAAPGPAGLVATAARLRRAAEDGIVRFLPEPQASLATGVLLGGSGHLSPDMRLDLQRSGLGHLLAIDGFKQVVVSSAVGAVAVRLIGPRLAVLPIGLVIGGYTLLTGAHPSAVRAGLMLGLAMLASLGGRVADPLTGVLLAGLAMAAVEPRILLDVGLQLSLSATLGIVLLWPCLRRRLRRFLPRLVAEPCGLTLAVSLASLPVVLSAFEMVSLVSPLAHVLAVPLLAPVLLGSALLALVSPVQPLGLAAAWLVSAPATLLALVIHWCGALPGAALTTGRLPTGLAILLAGGLLAWGIWGLPELAAARRAWRAASLARRPIWTPAMAVAMCLVGGAVLQAVRPDGRLHVARLAAGPGEALFVRGPAGRTVLIAGGRLDPGLLASQVADHLAIWEHQLEDVVALDAGADTALRLTLSRYPARVQLSADRESRLDLGGGAALDVYPADGRPQPDLSISFGGVWLPLSGRPPPPDQLDLQPALDDADPDIVSDGVEVWPGDATSGPTTSAARPGSPD